MQVAAKQARCRCPALPACLASQNGKEGLLLSFDFVVLLRDKCARVYAFTSALPH